MKLSDLRTASEIHEQNMGSPEYKREYDRTKLANDVALRVLAYRTERDMSQSELARRLGMRQPNIARLESGEHEPSLSTLQKLSAALGVDFSIDIKAGGVKLRKPAARPRLTPTIKFVSGKNRAVVVPFERQGRQRSVPPRSSVTPAARHRGSMS